MNKRTMPLRGKALTAPAFGVALWLLATATVPALSATQFLRDDESTAELTGQTTYASGQYPAAAVLSGRAQFLRTQPRATNGIQTTWLRVPLAAERAAFGPWVILLPRTVTRGEAYIPNGTTYRAIAIGSSIAYARRADRYMIVGITVDRAAAGSGNPLYLHIRYRGDSPLWVRAQTLRARLTQSALYRIIDGVFFGILLAVGFCNLYVAVVVRDRSAAWFVAYVGALIANELVMKGLGAAFLWPNAAFDDRWAGTLTTVAAFGTFLGFTRSFLQTRTAAPLWDRLLIGIFAVVAVTDVLRTALSGDQRFGAAVLLIEFGALAVTMGAGAARIRGGYHPARFFVLAFVPTVVGIMVNLSYGVFTPAGNWFVAENGVEFGVMAECVILSFSLLDRIRTLDAQRAKTEAELMRTAQRNIELTTLATRDPLTGISNRLAFFETLEDEIEYANRTGLLLGVLYIDLDDFKVVNDRYGHRVGDILLQIFSRRLKNAVRPADTVARLGGDEFAVLVTGLHDASVLESVQNNVVHILDSNITIEGVLITVGMSVGAAIFPRDGTEADGLIEAADHRMYHAKQGGTQALAAEGGSTSSPA
ncbi:MAG TPA: diguanylate cyclase [Candidatus Rubrimentiphilum sp.]|nr:diguanylate cyclase [Candidatus Rubrimentiphilum sp.]